MKIPWQKPTFRGRERAYLLDALESGWISQGPYIRRFEEAFARMNKARYGLTVCNGTSALALSLLALDIKKDDEVIVPGYSFVAPIHMVLALGAKPVLADVDPLTWCLDPASVEQRITRKTRALIAVHTYGNMCAMDALKKICRRRRMALIEDAAEAAFSRYRGRYAGTIGDIGTFSFHAAKTVAMGEGGCVLTRERRLYERMRALRDRGATHRSFQHARIGYNFRLTNLQAALGCAQLECVDKTLAAKQRIHAFYVRRLGPVKGIRFQLIEPKVSAAIWCVAVILDPRIFGMSRDLIMAKLAKHGIETRPGFSLPRQLDARLLGHLPVTKQLSRTVLCLPSGASLTAREISYVCDRLP